MAGAPENISRQRGRPRIEDAAEIDSTLLAAALNEFIVNGFDKASMRSIAKAANVHRATLIGRFATKEELFQAIMKQQIDKMSAVRSLESDGHPDLRRGLAAYANRALEFSLEGDYLAINQMIYASANRFPAVAAAAKQSTAVGNRQISEFIRLCAQADGITCRNAEFVAESFTFLLRGWYGYAILNEQPVTEAARKAWVEQMVDMLIAGRSGW